MQLACNPPAFHCLIYIFFPLGDLSFLVFLTKGKALWQKYIVASAFPTSFLCWTGSSWKGFSLSQSAAPPSLLCVEEQIQPPLQLLLPRLLCFCAEEAGGAEQFAPSTSVRTHPQRLQLCEAAWATQHWKGWLYYSFPHAFIHVEMYLI